MYLMAVLVDNYCKNVYKPNYRIKTNYYYYLKKKYKKLKKSETNVLCNILMIYGISNRMTIFLVYNLEP